MLIDVNGFSAKSLSNSVGIASNLNSLTINSEQKGEQL